MLVAFFVEIEPVACGRSVVIVALRLVRVGVIVVLLIVWSWFLANSNIDHEGGGRGECE